MSKGWKPLVWIKITTTENKITGSSYSLSNSQAVVALQSLNNSGSQLLFGPVWLLLILINFRMTFVFQSNQKDGLKKNGTVGMHVTKDGVDNV